MGRGGSGADLAGARASGGAGRLRAFGLVLGCALILMIPAALNGRPFMFFDTQHYYLVGRAITAALAPEAVSAPPSAAEGAAGPAVPAGAEAPPVEQDGALAEFAGGRSPVYALVFYLLSSKASMWLVVFAQALLMAWLVVDFLAFAWGRSRPLATVGVVVGLSGLSSLGYFVGYMMPDLFAGALLLAFARLAFDRTLGLARTVALAGVVGLAAVVHASTLAVGLALSLALGLGLLLARWGGWATPRPRLSSLCWGGAALAGALAFAPIYERVAEAVSGDRVGSLPYLTARVIVDGPGAHLLDDVCGETPVPYAACVFAGGNYRDHKHVLSIPTPGRTTYNDQPLEVRLALQDEQSRFVATAVAREPFAQIRAAIGNAARQLWWVGVEEVMYDARLSPRNPPWTDVEVFDVSPGFSRCLAEGTACERAQGPRRVWSALVRGVNLAACVGLVALLGIWIAARTGPRGGSFSEGDALLGCGVLFVLALLANAAVCGALSGPEARYQARVAWVAPLFIAAAAPWVLRLRASMAASAPDPVTERP